MHKSLRRAVGVRVHVVQQKLRSDVHCLVHPNQIVTVPLEVKGPTSPLNLRQAYTAQSATVNAPSAIHDYLGWMCCSKSLDATVGCVADSEPRPLKPSDCTQAEACPENKR